MLHLSTCYYDVYQQVSLGVFTQKLCYTCCYDVYEGSTCERGVQVAYYIIFMHYNMQFVTYCHFIITSYNYSTMNNVYILHKCNETIFIILYKLPFELPETLYRYKVPL